MAKNLTAKDVQIKIEKQHKTCFIWAVRDMTDGKDTLIAQEACKSREEAKEAAKARRKQYLDWMRKYGHLKELKNGQQVRRTDDQWQPEMKVRTLIGGVRKDFQSYRSSNRSCSFCLLETTEDMIYANDVTKNDEGLYYGYVKDFKRACELTLRRERVLFEPYGSNAHEGAYVLQSAVCLTADYPGKSEDMRKKREAYQNAVILEDNEEVVIEGEIMTVHYLSRSYDTPIIFKSTTKERKLSLDEVCRAFELQRTF